jgi:hypothetical protein
VPDRKVSTHVEADEPEPRVTVSQMMQQLKWAVESSERDERERCARIAENHADGFGIYRVGRDIALKIREGK